MLFQYNNESVILLIPFVQGIVYFILLLSRSFREERLSDRLLGLLLLGSTLYITNWMLGFAGWYDVRDHHTTFMFYMPWNHLIVLGPLIYYYFRSKTNFQFHFKIKDYVHFVPWMVIMAIYLFGFSKDVVIDHWAIGNPLPEFNNTKGPWAQWYNRNVFRILEIVSIFFYIILTLRTFKRYKAYVHDHFSDPLKVDLRWLRIILVLFIVAMMGNLLIQVIDYASGSAINYRQAWISHLIIGIMIYFTAIYGYHSQSNVEQHLNFRPEDKDNSSDSKPTTDLDLHSWRAKIDRLIETKIYLQPDLTLQDMATQLKTNSSRLSKIINQGYNQNFNDFINSYRIKEIEKMLKNGDHKTHTLTSLAFGAGFNSKATFNRAFKKHLNQTPREYIAELKLP